MAGTMFSDSADRGIHPGILNYIQDTLEELPFDQARNAIQQFLVIVRPTPPSGILRGVSETINNLLALYINRNSAATFGFTSIEAFQEGFHQALRYYNEKINIPSAIATNPIPNLLGVQCFSLRSIGSTSSFEFDTRVVQRYDIPVGQYFARMSSSSMGMVVQVSHTQTSEILQERLALVYRPTDADNPFEIRVVAGSEKALMRRVNEIVAANPSAAIELDDGSRIIPINSHLVETLASLGDERANLANAKSAFAAKLGAAGLTPFQPPLEAAAASYASGRDAYTAYGVVPPRS